MEILLKKTEMAGKASPTKQGIIQKTYKDVIVGNYYNLQMRGDKKMQDQSDQTNAAFIYDPAMFMEDTGEREE